MKKVLFALLVLGVLMLGSVFAASAIPEDTTECSEDTGFTGDSNTNPLTLGGEGGGSGSGGVPG